MNKGFTLIESMVILSMIAILSIATFPAYKSAKENLALYRSANMLAQDIRLTIEKAMSAQEANCVHPNYAYGYGVSLKKNSPEEYVLFSDCNGNGVYESGSNQDEFINKRFEDGIEIKNLSRNFLNVVFKPPDPTVTIKETASDSLSVAWITIGIIGQGTGPTKTITINKVGLIDID